MERLPEKHGQTFDLLDDPPNLLLVAQNKMK